MSWNGFAELDLSGVQADVGSARLPEGTYRVRCTDAKIVAKDGSRDRALVVDLVCQDGHGDIKVNFNVSHSSAQAQDIALRQLKGFLEVSGHPNPNKPGDVKTLVGLSCVIAVGMGKPWTDDKGKQRQNTEVKKYFPYDTPVSGPAPAQTSSGVAARNFQAPAGGNGGARRDLDDEIPF
ncbi:hypothetical protein EBZ39_08255 [bacterium]|nr:hypothetical protein [bacterium]